MTRRRAILAVLAIGAVAACTRDPQGTPEGTLAAWVAAMNASRSDIGARRRAYELLSGPARAALAERAARATQLSGREIAPWEMLAPGRFAMRFSFDPDALRATVTGDRATVTARGPNGELAEVPMVREEGRWRVDLVLPAMRAPQAEGDAGAS